MLFVWNGIAVQCIYKIHAYIEVLEFIRVKATDRQPIRKL